MNPLDLAGVPHFARPTFLLEHARPHGGAAPVGRRAQASDAGIAPSEQRPSSLPGVPTGALFAPFVVLLFSLSTLACGSRPEPSPAVVPLLPPAGAASSSRDLVASREDAMPRAGESPALLLDAQLDELLARAERLADTAVVAREAAATCVEACSWWGVAELVLEAGRARCVCTRPPDLGRRPVTSIVARAPEERGQRDSKDIGQQPGAVEDTRAGLASAEDRG